MLSRVAILALVGLGVATATASGQDARSASGLSVTYAARVCPSYEDITANKQRNNIQESLRDLGPDSPYRSNELVSAAVEDTVQPNCRALPGWRFTLGRDIRERASVGPWGDLSIVTDPFPTSIVTASATPLLDDFGRATGTSLAGAVTVALTQAQATLATRGTLWVQGGTPDDPVAQQTAPDRYGFGALRCAADDVNGDNVEYISFPSGRRHVFCFAYYVSPPPTAGTIVVRKRTVDAPAGATETFPFRGNISYTEDHRFGIAVTGDGSSEETFVRGAVTGAEEPWSFSELVPDGWRLTDLACSSATGASGVTTSQADASVSVRLAAEDTVTCTFTDTPALPPGRLLLRKVTFGALGSFPFAVGPAGEEASATATATTVQEGVAAAADPERFELDPGRYRVRERIPDSARGTWALTGVRCGDRELDPENPQLVDVISDRGLVCTYTNRFTPAGSITIRTITLGGAGHFDYRVTSDTPGFDARSLGSDTQRERERVTATGADLSRVPLQDYTIRQQQSATPEGTWELVYVVCDGGVVPYDQGRVRFELTREDADRDCTFVNRLVRGETPTPTPVPTPTPTPTTPAQPTPAGAVKPVSARSGRRADPRANLVVEKVATRRTVRIGQTVVYRVRVTNRGPSTAVRTEVAEQRFALHTGARLLSLRLSRGRCFDVSVGRHRAPICRLGSLRPGASATLRAVVRPTRLGSHPNRVVASSDTVDPDVRRAIAVERVVVLPRADAAPVDGLG